jgi:hypothetical protein
MNQHAELSLIAKLRSLDQKFAPPPGLSTTEQRQQVVRIAIEPWLETTFAVRNGKRITMAMQYADAYGCVP